MSILTDTNFLLQLSPRLDKFKKVRDYLWNFRCPHCGDSQRNKNKARGYVFRKKSDLYYKCHNCGVGRSLANFLRDQDTHIYDQYIMEKFKEGRTGKGTATASPKFNFTEPKFLNL